VGGARSVSALVPCAMVAPSARRGRQRTTREMIRTARVRAHDALAGGSASALLEWTSLKHLEHMFEVSGFLRGEGAAGAGAQPCVMRPLSDGDGSVAPQYALASAYP
jgi:hypothetical protein